MAPRAVWTTTVRRRSADPDGTLKIEVDILDKGKLAAELNISISADRDLAVVFQNVDGAPGLRGFTAWEKGGA